MNDSASRASKQRRRGKARAILAGGLVAALGIGGTLATWNTGVAGKANIAGGDKDSIGLLEMYDPINNVWFTTEGSPSFNTAKVIANIKLPDIAGGNERKTFFETRVRITGVNLDESFGLAFSHTGIAATEAAKSVKSAPWISKNQSACSTHKETDKEFTLPTSSPTSIPVIKTKQYKGPQEWKLCAEYTSSVSEAPRMLEHDVARWAYAFTADGGDKQ